MEGLQVTQYFFLTGMGRSTVPEVAAGWDTGERGQLGNGFGRERKVVECSAVHSSVQAVCCSMLHWHVSRLTCTDDAACYAWFLW